MQLRSGPSTIARPPIGRVLLGESGLVAFAAALAWLTDATTGKSVLAGGLIFLLPHAWFAWKAYRTSGAGAAAEVVQGFYRAESGKFLLTAAGFAIAFAYVGPLQAAALLGTYIALYVVHGVLMPLVAGL
jgi:ATP synthase protein I